MRRSNKEIKDMQVLESIMNEADACRIAMVDGDSPYIVPMNFAHKAGCLYMHSAREGRKLDILKKNSRVCHHEQICRKKLRIFTGVSKKYNSNKS